MIDAAHGSPFSVMFRDGEAHVGQAAYQILSRGWIIA